MNYYRRAVRLVIMPFIVTALISSMLMVTAPAAQAATPTKPIQNNRAGGDQDDVFIDEASMSDFIWGIDGKAAHAGSNLTGGAESVYVEALSRTTYETVGSWTFTYPGNGDSWTEAPNTYWVFVGACQPRSDLTIVEPHFGNTDDVSDRYIPEGAARATRSDGWTPVWSARVYNILDGEEGSAILGDEFMGEQGLPPGSYTIKFSLNNVYPPVATRSIWVPACGDSNPPPDDPGPPPPPDDPDPNEPPDDPGPPPPGTDTRRYQPLARLYFASCLHGKVVTKMVNRKVTKPTVFTLRINPPRGKGATITKKFKVRPYKVRRVIRFTRGAGTLVKVSWRAVKNGKRVTMVRKVVQPRRCS